MADRLVLHIGPHKTGTTAIQYALRDAAAILARNEWSYPLSENEYAQHRFCAALARNDDDAEPMFAKMSQSSGNLVLSSENFSRLAIEPLQRLARFVSTRTVAIVYYQRNFLDLAYSSWQERVKHGSGDEFPEYLALLLGTPGRFHLFSPSSVLSRFAAVFGRESVSVYLYDVLRESTGPGIVGHFFAQVLSLPDAPPTASTPRAVNASLSRGRAEIQRMLNALGTGKPFKPGPSATLAELRRGIDDREEAYLSAIELSYSMLAFRRMERVLLDQWTDRTGSPLPAADTMFSRRKVTATYMNPRVWVAEPRFAELLRAL